MDPLCNYYYKKGGLKFIRILIKINFILVKEKKVINEPQFHFQFASHFYYTIIQKINQIPIPIIPSRLEAGGLHWFRRNL